MDLDMLPLEDGEIFEVNAYCPLERPANYAAAPDRFPAKAETESDGELQSSSASDSDSDAEVYTAKKPKITLRAPPRPEHSKRKKYDIWSTRVHDDVLSETLVSCNVTQRDMSRNVESYDYPLSEDFEHRNEEQGNGGKSIKDRIGYLTKGKKERMRRDNSQSDKERNSDNSRHTERTNNKRRFKDRNDKSLKLVGKEKKQKEEKGAARYLSDLKVDPEMSDKDFAVQLANKLFEEKEELIEKVVVVMGQEKTKKIYDEVQKIEADGGMFYMNHSRRRTPGGVFLFLLRHDSDITKEQNDMIFEVDRQNYKIYLKARKKQRMQQIKAKIAAQKNTNLPELLTRSELVEKLNSESWSAKESDQDDVTNPPPTPETDCHADSGDGLDASEQPASTSLNNSYESDYLDINAGNEMDLF